MSVSLSWLYTLQVPREYFFHVLFSVLQRKVVTSSCSQCHEGLWFFSSAGRKDIHGSYIKKACLLRLGNTTYFKCLLAWFIIFKWLASICTFAAMFTFIYLISLLLIISAPSICLYRHCTHFEMLVARSFLTGHFFS